MRRRFVGVTLVTVVTADSVGGEMQKNLRDKSKNLKLKNVALIPFENFQRINSCIYYISLSSRQSENEFLHRKKFHGMSLKIFWKFAKKIC